MLKLFGLTKVNIANCPFKPDTIRGKAVLAIIGDWAICG